MDPDRAAAPGGLIPPDVVAVAESGIRDDGDVRALAAAGYQAVLVGESLVRAPHRRAALRALTGHRVGARAGPRPEPGQARGEPVLVKICGITSEADALLAVGLGADAVGFVFAPSPRQVAPQAVRRIIERLPPEIMTVGVFRDEAPARVVEIVNGIGLRAAQLHGARDRRGHPVGRRSASPSRSRRFPPGTPTSPRIEDYGVDCVLVDAAVARARGRCSTGAWPRVSSTRRSSSSRVG